MAIIGVHYSLIIWFFCRLRHIFPNTILFTNSNRYSFEFPCPWTKRSEAIYLFIPVESPHSMRPPSGFSQDGPPGSPLSPEISPLIALSYLFLFPSALSFLLPFRPAGSSGYHLQQGDRAYLLNISPPLLLLLPAPPPSAPKGSD